jgi:hypothetical protein
MSSEGEEHTTLTRISGEEKLKPKQNHAVSTTLNNAVSTTLNNTVSTTLNNAV